jgi:hypothetical protein
MDTIVFTTCNHFRFSSPQQHQHSHQQVFPFLTTFPTGTAPAANDEPDNPPIHNSNSYNPENNHDDSTTLTTCNKAFPLAAASIGPASAKGLCFSNIGFFSHLRASANHRLI